jgi:hypothetical protein
LTLPIPLDAFEAHAAVIGTTGSGKSTLVRAAMADLVRAGRWVGSIDKMGNQWGLTLSADGQQPGVDFVIFGGRHGHVPMAPGDGARIAGLFADQRFAAIFDVSQWKPGEQERWVADFADEIFRLNRSSLHLILDEAQSWIPQTGSGGGARESVLRLATQGRGNGIHLLMACQRVSTIDKTALSMAPLLVVMRTLGRIDTARARDEIEARVGTAPAIDLHGLATGQGIVAAPLAKAALMAFPLPDTFDSSRTPRHGDAAFTPPPMSSALVEALRSALAPAPGKAVLPEEGQTPPADNAQSQADAVLIEHMREDLARLRKEKYELRQTFVGFLDREARAAALIEQAAAVLREDPRKEAPDDRERISRTTPPVHRADRDAGGREEGDQRRHPGRVLRGQGHRVRHENDEGDRQAAPDGSRRAGRGRGAARNLQDGARAGGLNSTAERILATLRFVAPASLTWAQATTLAGRKTGNGNWYQARNALVASGLLIVAGDRISVAAAGPGRDFNEACELWKSMLPKPAPAMIDALLAVDAPGLSRPDLAAAIGTKSHGNGYFYGGIKALRDAGVIIDDGKLITLASPLPGETV